MRKKSMILMMFIILSLVISGCALFVEDPARNIPPAIEERPEPVQPEKPQEAVDEPGLAGIGGISMRDLPDQVASWFSQRYKTKGAYVYQHPNYVYILFAAGEKPTGGHTIEVKDMNLEDFPRVITIEFVPPAPGAMVTQAITHPSLIISVETDEIADYVVRTGEGQELDVEDKIIVSALELPKEEDTVENPLRVKGKIAAFEAMFVIRVYDANDTLLKEQIMMADGGGPMWGRFDDQLEYANPGTDTGRLEIGEFSAEDGSYKLRESVNIRFR